MGKVRIDVILFGRPIQRVTNSGSDLRSAEAVPAVVTPVRLRFSIARFFSPTTCGNGVGDPGLGEIQPGDRREPTRGDQSRVADVRSVQAGA